MRIALRHVTWLSLVLLGSSQAWAGEGDYKKCQYYRGIAAEFTIVETVSADVDEDGGDEVLIAYREPEDALDQRGGLLILEGASSGCRVAWHGMFERVFPEKIAVKGKAIQIGFVWKTEGGAKKIDKTLVVGKDLFFRGAERSTFAKVTVKASSTLKADGVKAANVFDRDLQTGWAEGAEGTGVDETLTLDMGQAAPVALIGVLHGYFRGKRYWLDNNRLHRAEVTIETKSDRYDTDSDVDFGEDLGLGLYGDRLDLSFSNKPIMRYFKVGKRDVISLELKITSVLLGEKNDDTYVSEIDLVELVPAKVILGQQAPSKPKEEGKEQKKQEEDAGDDWTDDF